MSPEPSPVHRRRLVPVGAATALAAIGFVGGSAVADPAAPPDEIAADADREGLRIVGQRFAVAAGDELELSVALGGAAGDRQLTGDETLGLAVHRRVETVTELDQAAGDDRSDAGGATVAARFDLADLLDPDSDAATATFSVSIDIDSVADHDADADSPTTDDTDSGDNDSGDPGGRAITVPSAGIYPVTIVVDGGGEHASATTVIAVHNPDDPDGAGHPVELAILAGVDDPGAWPSAETAAAAAESLDRATSIAAAVDAPLSWRLPPRLLGGVASGGERVATTFAGDDLLTVPAIALDPAAVAGVGADLFFTRQLVAGEAAAAAAAPLATRGRSVWVATTPLSRPAATLLRSVGVQLVIVTPDAAQAMGIDTDTGAFTIATDGDLSLTALVANPVGDRLAAAAPAGSTPTPHAAFTAAAVLLTALAGDGAPLALATADVGLPDADIAAAFAAFVDEIPSLEIVGASALTTPAGVAVANASSAPLDLPVAAGDDLAARLDQIAPTRVDVAHVRSMLPDPTVADAWDAELDELLGTGVDDATAADRLAATSTEIADLLGSIVGPEGFSFTLTGTSSELPLTIGNESPHDADVVVRVRSSKLHPADLPVTIPAGEEVSLRVPVTARSGGSFSVEVTVHTPDGFRITDPVGGRVTVTRVTGLSQALTAGAVLALASWWFHHLRRRHTRDEAAATAAE